LYGTNKNVCQTPKFYDDCYKIKTSVSYTFQYFDLSSEMAAFEKPMFSSGLWWADDDDVNKQSQVLIRIE
jgi:hypothetical protein